MELLLLYATVGSVALLAAMSPGPDFIVVSKNSISHSRSAGIYTALGVGAASVIHVLYTILGIGFVISQSVILFSIIKFAGAIYLVYLGVSLMTEKSQTIEIPTEISRKTRFDAFREGVYTSLLNPKATLFFVSIFSQFVSPALPVGVRVSIGIETAGIISAWFVLLAAVLTLPSVRGAIQKIQTKLMKVMGAALIVLGVRLADSQQ